MAISRDEIIAVFRNTLEPLPYVQAMFEGGSAAFGRVDEYSDIDMIIDAEDGHEVQVFKLLEAALSKLAPIDLRYELPTPTWHGMAQCFYHLAGCNEFLVLDVCVRPKSKVGLLSEREQHGEPLVYFNKTGVALSSALDMGQHLDAMQARRETLRATFPLFAPLAVKEAKRGRALDALHCYMGYVLRPLVEVLRMRYCPERYSFGLRYLDFDLPQAVVAQLIPLAFPASPADIITKYEPATVWFYEEMRVADAASNAGK